MGTPQDSNKDDLVPLAQAGIPPSVIDQQLERLCHSGTFLRLHNVQKLLRHLVVESRAGNTHRLKSRAIATVLYGNPESTQIRVDAKALRERLEEYYNSRKEANRDGIRFFLPLGQYVIHAQKAAGPSAKVVEPLSESRVFGRVVVKTRIDAYDDYDARLWLITKIPCGDLYPHCRVTRNARDFSTEVVVGLQSFGLDEGAVYEILLVAAGPDSDVEFHLYRKSGRDGMGGAPLPPDCVVLDSIRLIRRANQPA